MQAPFADGKLREREFQYRKQCFQNYNYDYRYTDEQSTSEKKTGDMFNDVVKFVKSSLIELGKTCSMEALVEIYGKDPEGTKD